MKRLLSLLLVLCLALGLSGCGSTKAGAAQADNSALYAHGMELAGLLDEMLSSPEYFDMMSGSDEIRKQVSPFADSDLSNPESAYIITLPGDALGALMNEADIAMEDFSEPLRDFMERRMVSSVPSILNSRQGAEALAAASIFTVSDIWPGEDLGESCYLLLVYPDACPVAVSFTGGKGCVSGTATLLVGQELEEDTLEAVGGLFEYFGFEADVEEIGTDEN